MKRGGQICIRLWPLLESSVHLLLLDHHQFPPHNWQCRHVQSGIRGLKLQNVYVKNTESRENILINPFQSNLCIVACFYLNQWTIHTCAHTWMVRHSDQVKYPSGRVNLNLLKDTSTSGQQGAGLIRWATASTGSFINVRQTTNSVEIPGC